MTESTDRPNSPSPSWPYARSKTLATWLAVVGGSVGLHHLYLRGLGTVWAWLHLLPTGLGLLGVLRMRELGQDDRLAWIMIPFLGVMLAQGMLHGIVYGLTPDAKWHARFNEGYSPESTAWAPVLGVITGLMVGAAILMGTIAFGIQKIFEW
jgi:hypothetical protein